MGWFTPTHRRDHPCFTPSEEVARAEHRVGEMWRCEVCDSLWEWTNALQGSGWWLILDWSTRWRNRKQGYTRRGDW